MNVEALALETGLVEHRPPGAYMRHDGFLPNCPFCQDAFTEALTLERAAAQRWVDELLAERDKQGTMV